MTPIVSPSRFRRNRTGAGSVHTPRPGRAAPSGAPVRIQLTDDEILADLLYPAGYGTRGQRPGAAGSS